MDDKSNESGPSRPKRVCSGCVYETTIEKMLFESESDVNFDCTDSGSDYMAADDSDSSESDVLSGNIQQLHVQTIIPNTEVVENVVDWKKEEMDKSNFVFDFLNSNLLYYLIIIINYFIIHKYFTFVKFFKL